MTQTTNNVQSRFNVVPNQETPKKETTSQPAANQQQKPNGGIYSNNGEPIQGEMGDTFTSNQHIMTNSEQIEDAQKNVAEGNKMEPGHKISINEITNPFESQCAQIADADGNGEIDDNEREIFGQLVNNAILDASDNFKITVGGTDFNPNELETINYNEETGKYTAIFQGGTSVEYQDLNAQKAERINEIKDAKNSVAEGHKLEAGHKVNINEITNPFENKCAQIADTNGNGEIDDNEREIFGQLVNNGSLDSDGNFNVNVGGSDLNPEELENINYNEETGKYTANFQGGISVEYQEQNSKNAGLINEIKDAKSSIAEGHKLEAGQKVSIEDMTNPFEKQCAQIADADGNGEIDDNEKAVFGQLINNSSLDAAGAIHTQVGEVDLQTGQLEQLKYDEETSKYTAKFKSGVEVTYNKQDSKDKASLSSEFHDTEMEATEEGNLVAKKIEGQTVTLASYMKNGFDYKGTQGIDQVLFSGSKVGSLDTGDGNDKVNLSSCEVSNVDTGDGNDNITINSSKINNISSGKGKDYVHVSNSAIKNLDLGDGIVLLECDNTDKNNKTFEKDTFKIENLAGDSQDTYYIDKSCLFKIGNIDENGKYFIKLPEYGSKYVIYNSFQHKESK